MSRPALVLLALAVALFVLDGAWTSPDGDTPHYSKSSALVRSTPPPCPAKFTLMKQFDECMQKVLKYYAVVGGGRYG